MGPDVSTENDLSLISTQDDHKSHDSILVRAGFCDFAGEPIWHQGNNSNAYLEA